MDKNRRIFARKRYMPIAAIAFLVILTCILSACGFNSGTSTASGGSSSTPTPVASTPTVTTVAGYGTAQGCPSDSVVSNIAKANVVATVTGAMGQTVTAHTGDIIELHMPFGKKWSGPQSSLSGLTLQTPSGYALKSNNSCVWRFDAKDAGTTTLTFTSRPICKKGQMCPMYIANVQVTIDVK